MNIVPDTSKSNATSNVEIEQVQQEQTEYCLLGVFLRTKGLNLFFYDPQTGITEEATIKYSDTIHVYKMPDDRFITIDWESQKTTVEGRHIYFEALNMKSALHRVKRYKAGLIKYLPNLRVPNPEEIKFY